MLHGKSAIRFASVLIILGLFCSLAFAGNDRYQDGDVVVHLNGGDDVAYIGQNNTIEYWIMNDAKLTGMSIAFEFSIVTNYAFDPNHGGPGRYVKEWNDAVNTWDLIFIETPAINGISPDSIRLYGDALMTGLPANALRLCYTMEVHIPAGEPMVPNGFCIDNIFIPPTGYWRFEDYVGYAPDYQGNPNSEVDNPDAPPVCFDIFYKCGDVKADGGVNIVDLTYLVEYLFGTGDPPPVPAVADMDGPPHDGLVNIVDLTYLVAYLFDGGPEPDCG